MLRDGLPRRERRARPGRRPYGRLPHRLRRRRIRPQGLRRGGREERLLRGGRLASQDPERPAVPLRRNRQGVQDGGGADAARGCHRRLLRRRVPRQRAHGLLALHQGPAREGGPQARPHDLRPRREGDWAGCADRRRQRRRRDRARRSDGHGQDRRDGPRHGHERGRRLRRRGRPRAGMVQRAGLRAGGPLRGRDGGRVVA